MNVKSGNLKTEYNETVVLFSALSYALDGKDSRPERKVLREFLPELSSVREEVINFLFRAGGVMFLPSPAEALHVFGTAAEILKRCANSALFASICEEVKKQFDLLPKSFLEQFHGASQWMESRGLEMPLRTLYPIYRTYGISQVHPQGRLLFGILQNDQMLTGASAISAIWHHLLHQILGRGAVSHALIFLIADNELFSHIGSLPCTPPQERSSNEPFPRGPAELRDLIRQISPFWSAYVDQERKDLQSFESEMIKRFG